MKLTFKDINKSYGSNHALDHFSAEFEHGIYALMGPNGSGKTTLINILTDNLKADSGEILYDGENILKLGKSFRSKIGFMPQYPGMYPGYTVEEFMLYMSTLKGMKKSFATSSIKEILEAVELWDVKRRKISALSGGMKQRLALAQAVLGDPEIIILDEPTAGLDPKQRISIRNYISSIALSKMVLIATHVVSDVEFIARDIIFLNKGIITDFAPAGSLTSKISGKVFEIKCTADDLARVRQMYRIISMVQSSGGLRIRVLSEDIPAAEFRATPVEPSLEDYYLYTFGENIDGY